MRWIIWRRVRLALDDHTEVRVGDVDPFVEDARCGHRIELPVTEIVEDLTPPGAAGRAGDEVDGDVRIEPVDRVVRRPHGLGEHQRTFGLPDRRREPAEELVLADRLGHDLAPLRERVEVLARGAAVGAGVPFGEMRDRGHEVAERIERHPRDLAEMAARAHQALFDRDVVGTLLIGEGHPDERHPRAGAHAVGDALFEPVAVADATEVGEQEIGDTVVAAFERRGEAEALLVLRQHRPSQGPATETVTLVRDQEPAGGPGDRPVRGRGVPRRDQDVAVVRSVATAVAQPSDAGVRQGLLEPAVPLLHEDA